MKKIALLFMAGVAFVSLNVQAETLQGKVVADHGDKIHVQATNENKPTELKMNPQTRYFSKKEVKNSDEADLDANEFVEIIYTIDPKTNELWIDEITIIED